MNVFAVLGTQCGIEAAPYSIFVLKQFQQRKCTIEVGSLEHILLTSYVKQHREEVVSKDKA